MSNLPPSGIKHETTMGKWLGIALLGCLVAGTGSAGSSHAMHNSPLWVPHIHAFLHPKQRALPPDTFRLHDVTPHMSLRTRRLQPVPTGGGGGDGSMMW